MTAPRETPSRAVHCEDALPWLERHAPLVGCSIVTSLPDLSGLLELSGLPDLGVEAWREWFVDAARACLVATPEDGVTIFYQTDIKHEGRWIDKSYLCHRAAEASGAGLLWHKIVCREPIGQAVFGRPGYAHLLCYSRGLRERAEPAYADVLPSTGATTWSRATGVAPCELACRYVLSHTQTRRVVDPFCGQGTVLAVANHLGLAAVGVELGKRRAKKARNLQFAQIGMPESEGT